MPNANYIAGRAFEYAIMRRLKLAGYWVLRAAGSKGPVDIIAIRTTVMLMIQCKRGKGIPSSKAWNELYDLALSRQAIPLLASRSSVKGDRRVSYQRLSGVRAFGEPSEDMLARYNPFGQEEIDL